jgi:hypothetical protein
MFKNNNSPTNKKKIYYEENYKQPKKKTNRISIEKPLFFDSSNIKENDINLCNKNNQRNINVKDIKNLKINYNTKKYKNFTQPTIIRKKPNINISSINEIDSIKEFGLLDDFLNELEENDNNKEKENGPMTNELNKMFEKSEYLNYCHPSRTQQSFNSNQWDDF